MPSDTDLLFGEIAVELKFCSRAQVDHCLAEQASAKSSMPVGRWLIDKGWLTEEHHAKILATQRKRMASKGRQEPGDKEAALFGQLVIIRGLLPPEKVNECLREQARPGEVRSLGEILVSKGYLTPKQVKETLAQQYKSIMSCPSCQVAFTVFSMSKKKQVRCPRCQGDLVKGKPTESTRTDGDLQTSTNLRALPPTPGKPGDTPWPVRTRLKVACRICSRSFEGLLDSTGRVRCPSCNTAFVVKRAGS